ncbi:hypothetical protein HOP50_14g72820 [Chloropicon primus]|uniref:Selenoprotein n=1 Tax=Chloropicon primus TaxID=1764295 RepID=A0A5B8MYM6_9CHLO|nr:hypothetical protein A3770_14p72630 [Chloropicon primus]UPR03951.1 hypothetical protein HOP50_14g72820 [Chloropicon primus]|mmetsp:Transcript_3534/g.9951  ORF Transcript_3534/g.9951 Transcript_3534/m.9951 type:complete len:94 (-) Transcript_3534:2798-3079(-)|eukprot:QDZ24745.1 hypothetical protein A3770_14p72630 [Chloropicon primus]
MRRESLVLLTAALCWASHHGAQASSTHHAASGQRTCTTLGFSGLHLCSDCEAFSRVVHHKGLIEDCYECCAKDNVEGSNASTRYVSAVLEICN